MGATRQLAATMQNIAAAIASAIPAALAAAILAATLAATISQNAFAHTDNCGEGLSRTFHPEDRRRAGTGPGFVLNAEGTCVNTNELEYWDWCFKGPGFKHETNGRCNQYGSSDCSVFQFNGGFGGGPWECINNGATFCPDHQAYNTESHDCADAPPAAPIITRPVAADWKNETFTVYWRPGAGGEVQNITGFQITREQVAVEKTAHPTVCDTATYPAGTNSINIAVNATAQVYKYTNNARGQNGELGVTHGNCYRWKIAAINAQGTGPEAITQPILSRGYVHNNEVFAYDDTINNTGTACGTGASRPYAYGSGNWGGICYPDAELGHADKCNSLRDDPNVGQSTRYEPGARECFVDYTGSSEAHPAVCTDNDLEFVSYNPGRERCGIPDQCGTLSEYNRDHRECHCQGWAQPAGGESAASPKACVCNVEGADANCQCPNNNYLPAENSCGCPAGETLNAATSYCIPQTFTGDLADEVVKASPDLTRVTMLLAAGAEANGLVDGVRFVLTAAALGHAALVSILITAGADPDAKHPTWNSGANIPHLMAAHNSPVNNLSTARRRDVLFHFGNAVAVRNVDFDYNALTGDGNHIVALLGGYTASGRPGANDPDLSQALEMTDYMLGRGMNCSHLSGTDVYGLHCIGSLGQAVVEVVNKDDGNRETAAIHRLYQQWEIRGLAQAVVDAGIPIDNLGSPEPYLRVNRTIGGVVFRSENATNEGGHLIPLAAFNGQYHALYVLLTFGMNPKGEANGGVHRRRSALGYITRFTGTAGDLDPGTARVSENGIRRGTAVHYDPPKALNVLRAYINGMRDAGVLSSFDGWNEQTTGYPDDNSTPERTALENFQTYASASSSPIGPFFGEEKDEIHALLYENGARCDSSRASGKYCELPVRAVVEREGAAWTGGVFTVTARAGSRFRAPVVSPAVSQALAGNGWTLAVSAAPDELVVLRSRRPLNPPTLDPAAVFTVTSFRGTEAIQAVPVSVALGMDEGLAGLAAAVILGDAAETGRLAGLVGEADILNAAAGDGTPLLLTAAALGHADVVSVLITAGANPDARLTDFHDVNVVHLMATLDGTEQADGSQLSRAARWEVLRHFGDALAVTATLFDWNAEDGNGNHATDLLQLSDDVSGAGDKAILRQMADYMLPRGMHCGHATSVGKRYNDFCVGTAGVSLAALIARPVGEGLEVSEILSAAGAMEAAGVSVTLAGSETEGALAALAAERFRGAVLSVLLTLGFDPEGRNADGRTAAHVIAFGAENDAAMMAAVLEYFIGGLEAAGELSGFGGWQTAGPGGAGFPLEVFHARASANNLHLEEKAEMHALFFDADAYCQAPIDGRRYCMTPVTRHHPTASDASTGGAVYTITARARAKFNFDTPPFEAGMAAATLAALGWTLALDAEFAVLSRTRRPMDGESPTVSFTLTMTTATGGGLAAHHALVEAEVVPSAYSGLIDAVEGGQAVSVVNFLGQLGDSHIDALHPSGVALVPFAAALGHAGVVSVLLAAGFDPNARHKDWDNGAVPHMMGRFDGPGISWAARLSVLRHFGDAVSVRATLFDWNATDDNGARMLDLLLAAAGRDGAGCECGGDGGDGGLRAGEWSRGPVRKRDGGGSGAFCLRGKFGGGAGGGG